ncbi:MAG: hypothetical protein Q8R24_09490 [Legionellaceae bacterium]|nr:hypothetical protein [Legionellaceae bacterium]
MGWNIHQADFIRKANHILPTLEYSLLDPTGECSTLANLYIYYAFQGRQADFFSLLKLITNSSLKSISKESGEKIEELMQELMIIKSTDGIYLASKKCSDVFSLITNDDLELLENIKKIIKKIQSVKQNVLVHITLGYLHSFVLEQRIEDDAFYYYLYDPNSCAVPKKISCLQDLIHEIRNVLEKIKFSLGSRYFFYEDEKALFSFYIYPEKLNDKVISSFYCKLMDGPYKDDINIKEVLNLIDLYHANLIAKNIVLIQIIEWIKKAPRARFYFTEEIRAIEREMSNHLYSMSFMPVDHHKYKVECFNYVKNYGRISLLHEVARIGDIDAVKALMPYSDLNRRSHLQTYRTPIDWSVMGSHPLILDLLLNESKNRTNKIHPRDCKAIENVVNCRSNAFNFSNTESKAMGHAIFNMFHLIQDHKVNTKPLSVMQTPIQK